ncbi:MAG: ectoine hydroxylase-related dioxygenase (phytanoyl-CoA dioxygenase family) [Parasphingorhabdus sp.]|jgi:ectoine hydroxylase-related dioxygenase (phytanoyl-CoA dioxygenase family)
MKPELQIVTNDIDPKELADSLNRDGAVIVEGALDQQQLTSLNSEVDDVIARAAPGLRHATSDYAVEFYGSSTIRLDGLPAVSRTFLEVMQLPLMSGVADELLLPNCEDYLLNTGQLIQIGPGETPQKIHRDEDAWSFFKDPKPLLQVEAMFALTDFTIANGATQVVPGSHLWSADREARPEEITQAEMNAGSALFYLGSTLHGGGTNTTSNEWRRGMFFGFVIGWLRTEENMFLTVPIDMVRKMPVRCQELLGYKAHRGIGVADVGSPMALLD